MKLDLYREPSQGGSTLGRLFCDGTFLCDVLEDEIREVTGVPVGNWKQAGVTAIPAGVYQVTVEHSPRFGPGTLTLPNVPGFAGIRIHAGNKHQDTEGCLLPGTRNSANTVRDSRIAVWQLRDRVVNALAAKEAVTICIRNPGKEKVK